MTQTELFHLLNVQKLPTRSIKFTQHSILYNQEYYVDIPVMNLLYYILEDGTFTINSTLVFSS